MCGRFLGSAQVKTRRSHMTGFLLYSGRHFVQVLEGRSADLDKLATVIGADARHAGLHILAREAILHRRYGAWDMGFVESLDDAEELDALFASNGVGRLQVDGILKRAARRI